MQQETLKLKFNRTKDILLFIVLAPMSFVLIQVLIGAVNVNLKIVVSIILLFFLFGDIFILICLVEFLTGQGYILLSPDGFTIKTLFKSRFIKWQEVYSFIVSDDKYEFLGIYINTRATFPVGAGPLLRLFGSKVALMNLNTTTQISTISDVISSDISSNNSIPPIAGYKTEEVVDILTQYMEKYGK